MGTAQTDFINTCNIFTDNMVFPVNERSFNSGTKKTVKLYTLSSRVMAYDDNTFMKLVIRNFCK